MSTVEVTSRIVDPQGYPFQYVGVSVVLVAPAGWLVEGGAVTGASRVTTDGAGAYTLRLAPQSEIEQPGTYYRVSEAPGAVYTIVVPDFVPGAGPVALRDVLVTPAPAAELTTLALDGLSDVSTSGAVPGDVLGTDDGTTWTARAPSLLGATVYRQADPAASWAVPGGRGREPVVSVFVDNRLVLADVEYDVTTDSLTVVHSAPATGAVVTS